MKQVPVTDPHLFNSDPDPAFYFKADPDPDPDPDPYPHQSVGESATTGQGSIFSLQASVVSVHGSILSL